MIKVMIDGVEYLPKNEIKEADLLLLIESLKKDAERYRQLRDNSHLEDVSIQYTPFGEDSKWLKGKDADIYIDAILNRKSI